MSTRKATDVDPNTTDVDQKSVRCSPGANLHPQSTDADSKTTDVDPKMSDVDSNTTDADSKTSHVDPKTNDIVRNTTYAICLLNLSANCSRRGSSLIRLSSYRILPAIAALSS